MNVNREYCSRCWILPVMGLLFLAASGCNSGHPIRGNESSVQQSAGVTNPSERQLDGGTYCEQTIAQGPPVAAPVHFSYKENESDGSSKDYEADLAGDTFDVTVHERHPATDTDRQLKDVPGLIPIIIRDGFAEQTRTNHYTRADAVGWNIGVNGIALGATPWGLFVAKPQVTRSGTEDINGYDTIKYTVDTTHQSQLDKSAFALGWGVKDYNITGSAWATKDTNCILQYAIDLEKNGKDGKVSKAHYEGGISKQ